MSMLHPLTTTTGPFALLRATIRRLSLLLSATQGKMFYKHKQLQPAFLREKEKERKRERDLTLFNAPTKCANITGGGSTFHQLHQPCFPKRTEHAIKYEGAKQA